MHVDYKGMFVALIFLLVGGLGVLSMIGGAEGVGVTLVVGAFAPFLLYVRSGDSGVETPNRKSFERGRGPGSRRDDG